MLTPTKRASNLRRRGDRGIVLITTLLLMMLLAGFAVAAQSRALAQVRVLDKVRQVEDARIIVQSARALALPLAGEAMLDGVEAIEFDVTVAGARFVFDLTESNRRDWYTLVVR